MRILSIQSNTTTINPYKPQFCAVKFKPTLNKDTFLRNESQDFLSLPTKDIFNTIRKSINNSQNKLGRGGEAEVWKLGNTGYCIRIPIDFIGKLTGFSNQNLTKNDKVNHVVAKLNGNITIMPVIEGFTFCSDNITNTEVTKMIENMPVNSYKDLINSIYQAETSTDMVFDSGWKNIIINPRNNTMTAIDFYKANHCDEFTNQILSSVYSSLANHPATTLKQKQICAGKLMLASVQLIKDKKIKLKTLGLDRLLRELKYQKVLDNMNYHRIIKNNFNDLSSADVDKTNAPYKILIALMKQLFGVTI